MSEPLRFANLLDGRLAPPSTGRWLDVHEPATGAVYALAPESGSADVAHAVAAARRVFPVWSATPPSERARLLNRLADLIERDPSEPDAPKEPNEPQ